MKFIGALASAYRRRDSFFGFFYIKNRVFFYIFKFGLNVLQIFNINRDNLFKEEVKK